MFRFSWYNFQGARTLEKWFMFAGPKEVKVLVDLAMISAQGQDDLEVQKVSCLHAAATGYAPLIYQMEPNMGFDEFLPLCQAVWRTLKVDDQLPKKFVRSYLSVSYYVMLRASNCSEL